MRTLALDYLFDKLGGKRNPPQNLEHWYRELRETHPEKLFPFLVESIVGVEKIYILEKDVEEKTVRLVPEDMTEEKAKWLPFIKPTGGRSPQIGPIIKVSKDSPKVLTLENTMKSWEAIADSDKLWSPYFREIIDLLNNPQIRLPDNSIIKGYKNLLVATIEKLRERKQNLLFTIRNKNNELPGQCVAYCKYLMKEKLAGAKYITKDAPAQDNQTCPLCGRAGVTVFPNALKGAGINISNVDRAGAFPNIDTMQAWKRYALCNTCADLLYSYKFHFLKKDSKNRKLFITPIAGDSAIVIPFTTIDYRTRQNIWRAVKDFGKSTFSYVEESELTILDILKNEKGILNFTFLWATVGQNIEDVTGMITDVPPTRLMELSKINETSNNWKHPIFPEIRYFHDKRVNFQPSLSLIALKSLFCRPGGKKVKDINASMKLRQLRKSVAAAIYHKTQIPVVRFWEEVMITARWYWLDAIENGNAYGLLNEGKKKTGETYLTAAGWIKHLCWWIYYFKKLEVMDMEKNFYEPRMEQLKPFFGQESGIDSNKKAFTFLLGVVFGRLLFAQSEAGVRLSALKWVKRFTISGKDLPELYKKIIAKVLEYQQYGDEKVVKLLGTKNLHQIIEELSSIGKWLGDRIELSSTLTCYYLLLGLSLSNKILRTKEKEEKENG